MSTHIYNIRVLESLKILTPEELERMVNMKRREDKVSLTDVMVSVLDRHIFAQDSIDEFVKVKKQKEEEEEELKAKEEEEKKKKEEEIIPISPEEKERLLRSFQYSFLLENKDIIRPKSLFKVSFEHASLAKDEDQFSETSMTEFILGERKRMETSQKKLKGRAVLNLYKTLNSEMLTNSSDSNSGSTDSGLLVNKKQG